MGNKLSGQKKIVHLLVPDLLAQPLSPNFAVLNKLSAKAKIKKTPHSNYLTTLFELFMFSESTLPVAAITHLYDTQSKDDYIWLRADPVYLQVTHHRINLLESEYLHLSQVEADKIIATLNEYYRHDNLEFSAPTPTRWYVKLPQLPKVTFTPLPAVMGKNIYALFPTGEDQPYWQQLLNEIQMLLHSHEVNEQREEQQHFPINSLWFWGAGQLPQLPLSAVWQSVTSDDPTACGLAYLGNIAYFDHVDSSTWFNQINSEGHHLLTLLPNYHQADGRDAWLQQLETTWFTPLFDALKQKYIDKLIVYPCNQQVLHISLQKWWQKLF